jgi:hypothetical protein
MEIILLNLKPKSLLLASAMVAVVLAASSRRAYASLNVVGYVNVPITNGYNFVANPLDASMGGAITNGNAITNVILSPPNLTAVYVWDVTNQAFSSPPSTYHQISSRWSDPTYVLPPGKGFVVYLPQSAPPFTNTFVGQVLQGSLTNHIAGTNKFSLLGFMLPIAGTLTNFASPPGLSFPGIDGADVFTWDTANQRYSNAYTFLNPLGWADAAGILGTNGPTIQVAQGFFVQNPGPDTDWKTNFTVQFKAVQNVPLSSQTSPASTAPIAGPDISQIAMNSGQVNLRITNPGGTTFSVQFSPDGSAWTTLATSQTGSAWKGSLPGGRQGYFRLTTP